MSPPWRSSRASSALLLNFHGLSAFDTPPDHPSRILAQNRANGRMLRSIAWLHFTQAADYETSRRSACVHCKKTFKSRYGSTSRGCTPTCLSLMVS